MPHELRILHDIPPEVEEAILDRLKTYNVETFGQPERKNLAIPLYDGNGEVAGGLTGYIGRGWLYVEMLFIPEEMRGQGLAGRLLQVAEDEARARGCIGAYIDTMNPQALRAYLRQGYREIGALKGLAGGHSVTWLEKRF